MPQESGLSVNNCFLPLHDDGSNQVGRWLVESAGWTPVEDAWDGAKLVPLDDVLCHVDKPTISERHAVLAVGSNASPGQLRQKFGTRSPGVDRADDARNRHMASSRARISHSSYHHQKRDVTLKISQESPRNIHGS